MSGGGRIISQGFWPLIGLAFFVTSVHASTSTLKLGTSQYVSSDVGAQNSSISLQIEREIKFRKSLSAKTEIKDEFSASENWNYLNIYQTYLSTRFPVGVSLDLGRKLETWSAVDNEWKLGVFQPRYMQNKLRPETAGLSGVFMGSSYQSALWTVGLLPIHVPDMGAHFWVADHKLVSKNPWFDPPASRFRIASAASEIRYTIDKPDIGEIISHPGAIAKIEFSRAQFGARGSAAFKPVPQLRLSFPAAKGVIVSDEEDYLNVRLTPQVQYHTVASTEIWTTIKGWQMTAGLTYDRPTSETYNPDWMNQTYTPAWIWSFFSTRTLNGEGASALRLKFGVIKIEGGRGRDRGVYSGERSLFEGRFQYSEAYMAGALWPVYGVLRRPIDLEGRIVFDRMQNGGWVRVSAGYNVTRELRLDADADLLGLMGPNAEVKDGFLSVYRANDRVGLGMSYVY